MDKRLMLLITFLFLGVGLTYAQVSKVTGIVTSEEDGFPVVGASVSVKGTTLGTITDIDGNFVLTDLPSSAKTLVISFIGMQTQEVQIKPTLNVILKSDTEVLEEVMVVAYGTAKKSAFTGSAAVMNADDIGKIQTSNATQALTGKVSGVQLNTASGQPGAATPSIRIRGISSINAGNEPLIILDGAPYDGDMNNINTQDIESMTVLKDAASNALYGARGANGVIMITTKKGKSGNALVTLDAKWGANTRATQTYDYITSPAQYYEMYYGALKNYYVQDQKYSEEQAHKAANSGMLGGGDYGLGYNVYTIPEGQYLIGMNGRLNPNAVLGRMVEYGGNQYYLTPDDWMKEAYGVGLRQEYNLSVSAGTEKSSFYSSVSYLNNDGITANSDYERLTGRLKADFQVKPWLKVGANMGYTHFSSHSLNEDGTTGASGNLFAVAMAMAPIYPLYIRDGNGNIMTDETGNYRHDYGNGDNAGLVRPQFSNSNPLSDNILNTNASEGNAFNANGFFEIRFLEDFKFTWNSGVNVDETRQSMVTNPYYGQYASSNGIANKYHVRTISYNHQQLLNYQKTFGNHNVGVMIGHESYRSQYYFLYGQKSNMFDPNNSELDGAITTGGTGSYTSDYNTEGYFGRVQYDFNEKYFASASYRRDASSRFHPDHRWGNFWSLGGAWMISKEDFYDLDWMNMLKLKASYGSQGNDNIGDFRYTNTYSIVNSGGHPAAIPGTLGNENITWETNGNFNAGVEFELFKGRISGGIEYFLRSTTDMLFSFPLPPSYGYTSYYANVGDMRNQGVEAEFNFAAFQSKDFNWDIRLNLTHYKNKIVSLPEERKTMVTDGVKGFSSGSQFFGEGIPLYTFRLKQYAGVNEEGEALYYRNETNEAGQTVKVATTDYSSADYYLCGTSLPKLYGGFGSSLSYKGFDFSFDFSYQLGGQVLDSDYAAMMASPQASSKGYNFHKDLLNAWSPSNPNSDIPRFQFGDLYSAASSDRFLTSASYLSLQNVNLGYTLPASLIRSLGIEKVRFYVSADNVWLLSKRKGLDPRQSISGSASAAYYAPMRTVSGGLTLTF